MGSESKVDKAVERTILDWLQWSDELEPKLGEPDYAQMTLTYIKDLRKENESLSEKLESAISVLELERQRNVDLHEKLRVAAEALEFYSDHKTYWMRHDSGDGFVNTKDVDLDCGDKAREALKKIGEVE